nr:putative integron gene cassette protein [uncultured bacterium]
MISSVRHRVTTMLAQIFAIAIVILAILGPGFFLWQFARKRGGLAEKFAWTILVAAVLLILWLLFFPRSGSTPNERISHFIGAWAILFMAAGFVVIGAELFKMIKGRKRP